MTAEDWHNFDWYLRQAEERYELRRLGLLQTQQTDAQRRLSE